MSYAWGSTEIPGGGGHLPPCTPLDYTLEKLSRFTPPAFTCAMHTYMYDQDTIQPEF